MTDGQARVVLQGADAKEAEEERLERRLREIMGDTQVGGMADIHVRDEAGNVSSDTAAARKLMAKKRSQRGRGGATTTSPIQESDMVKHYKSLFFARNGASARRSQPAVSSNGYTAHGQGGGGEEGSQQRWTTKYKTNIVPPHMKRPKPQNRSAVTRKIQSSLMSSLPPEQIPSYFSAPALARMEPKASAEDTEKKEGERQSEGRRKEEKGEGKRDLGADEETTVAKAELDQARLELEEAKERLQLYQDQGDRIQELEAQVTMLNETKLDAKGMSVSMQRQLTQLTGERQEMLLVSVKAIEDLIRDGGELWLTVRF